MQEVHVILTDRPGVYRTRPGPGLRVVEAWQFEADGRVRARFVIAILDAESHVTVIEDEPPHATNRIRTRFLPRFAGLQAARDEIAQLALSGGAQLRPVAAGDDPC